MDYFTINLDDCNHDTIDHIASVYSFNFVTKEKKYGIFIAGKNVEINRRKKEYLDRSLDDSITDVLNRPILYC